jgi:hypothetical protein
MKCSEPQHVQDSWPFGSSWQLVAGFRNACLEIRWDKGSVQLHNSFFAPGVNDDEEKGIAAIAAVLYRRLI